jgi:ketosteroid isomerase-like protein
VHPNEQLLRREYEGRARRDLAAVASTFHDDVVWHVPGRNAISGIYRGKEEVMEYVRRREALADGTFEITVHDVLANDEHGVVIASGIATRHGREWQWRGHGLYRFRDGKIAECWLLPEDQYLFDSIWSE